MKRFLRLEDLAQEIACPSCHNRGPVAERRHAMNFTTNIVKLTCPSCHSEIGRIPFRQWNALHQKAASTQRAQDKPA